MNWLPQDSVPDSVKPARYSQSALWLLGPDGFPLACVHYENFNSWGTNKPVFGVSMQTGKGGMHVQPMCTTDQGKAIGWAEAELERNPPRQLRMF